MRDPHPRPFIGVVLAIAVLVLLVHAFAVHAAPPAGADPNSPTAQWFRSLTQPGTGASCCDLSDCRPVATRIWRDVDSDGRPIGGYEVLVDIETFGPTDDQERLKAWQETWKQKFGDLEAHWVRVPPEKILQGKDNPLGRAVVCWTPGKDVICFVKPVEI